jgi:hypothetical protein
MTKKPKPDPDRFKDGLRAVLGTTKADSDAQLEAFQVENKKKREAKKTK